MNHGELKNERQRLVNLVAYYECELKEAKVQKERLYSIIKITKYNNLLSHINFMLQKIESEVLIRK